MANHNFSSHLLTVLTSVRPLPPCSFNYYFSQKKLKERNVWCNKKILAKGSFFTSVISRLDLWTICDEIYCVHSNFHSPEGDYIFSHPRQTFFLQISLQVNLLHHIVHQDQELFQIQFNGCHYGLFLKFPVLILH